jgi:hypothetical protein
MSHQIYYTSAPEGLKRGSSGFCTVAASDNIPRALWDRLEALSAYRHHFPASASAGSQNPVSHAHWLLSVAGSSYHVLSRICDSGVDHTQRTNAFAHHLVLDDGEMPPAGPAWMLQRAGVMAHAWDNHVGAIPPRNLPQGDTQSTVCREWERVTGDAGWGGHLADIFTKSPTKPVCILFAPGQDLLPLIAETIALLPHAARWNVTFNTYFTSMPTSATCVWRCCLADTPAAQIGLRYAANGIVIDLTDRQRLGAVPEGPYVTLARTGLPPAGVLRTTSAPAQRPAAVKANAPARARTAGKVEDLEELAEGSGLYDLAEEPSVENLETADTGPALPAAAPRPPRMKAPAPSLRKADAALRQAETDRSHAAAKRRKQIMLLFGSALAALAIGTLLIVILNNTKPPVIDPTLNTRPRVDNTAPPPPVYIAPVQDTPEAVKPVAPAPPASSPSQAIVVPDPTPANPATITITPTVVTPVAPKFPEVLTLTTVLEYPTPGPGIADRRQSLSFRGADLEPGPRPGRLVFPNGKFAHAVEDARGKLSLVPVRPRSGIASLVWSATGHEDLEIAVITLDRNRATVEVEWKSAALQKIPDVVRSAYWILQRSSFECHAPGEPGQRIVFKPVEEPVVKLTEASTPLFKTVEIPADASVALPALPPGWQAVWYTEWDVKDAALKTPKNASQVLKFHKTTTTAAVEAWFLLTFRPGFTKVESTFARRQAADEADLAKYESDLRALTADIEQYKKDGKNDNDLKPFRDKKDETQRLVDAYKAAVAGYKEITEFDVKMESPGGMWLTTLHFRGAAK